MLLQQQPQELLPPVIFPEEEPELLLQLQLKSEQPLQSEEEQLEQLVQI